jgi:hypothetical protein
LCEQYHRSRPARDTEKRAATFSELSCRGRRRTVIASVTGRRTPAGATNLTPLNEMINVFVLHSFRFKECA